MRSARRTAGFTAALALPIALMGTASAQDAGTAHPGRPGIGDPYFPTYGNGGYDVQSYDLAVRYDPTTGRLTGHAKLELQTTASLRSFDLDLVGLTVGSVAVDGAAATWRRQGAQELVVTPAAPLRRGEVVDVDVRYAGVPQPFTDPALGTYAWLTTNDGVIAIGEPEVAAHWFPVNDHPADKATYRIAITAPKELEAVSNGLVARRTVSGDWATTTWAPTAPMASYLAFLAIGHFDVHRWTTAQGLPIIDAVDSGIGGPVRQRIDASFARQGEILAAEAQWFGPYPFETAGGVVDRVDVGFALENQTRPTYSPSFWQFPGPPVYDTTVVVHELAHQWYGDSVAVRRWRDIWLNEGFATYAEWLWIGRELGITPHEQFAALSRIPAASPFWRLKIGDPGPARLFDGAVYARGAMTLQALREEVGDPAFFDILRSWAANHGGAHGTTDAFIALAESKAGHSLSGLFQTWLFTESKPATAVGPVTPSARDERADAAARTWLAGLQFRLEHGQR